MQNKAYRSAILADVNRIAAGLVAAAATGALAQLIPFGLGYLVGSHRGLVPGPEWAGGVYGMALGAVVVGSPWSILLMFVTRARLMPWRSLAVLPIGMALGYIWLSAPVSRIPTLDLSSEVFGPLAYLAIIVGGPIVGGLVAAQSLRWIRTPSAA